MTIEDLSAVFSHSRARGSAKLVLIALADQSTGDHRSSISLATLSRFAGVTVGAVRRAVGRLVTLGELDAALTDEDVQYEVRVSCSRSCRAHNLDRRPP